MGEGAKRVTTGRSAPVPMPLPLAMCFTFLSNAHDGNTPDAIGPAGGGGRPMLRCSSRLGESAPLVQLAATWQSDFCRRRRSIADHGWRWLWPRDRRVVRARRSAQWVAARSAAGCSWRSARWRCGAAMSERSRSAAGLRHRSALRVRRRGRADLGAVGSGRRAAARPSRSRPTSTGGCSSGSSSRRKTACGWCSRRAIPTRASRSRSASTCRSTRTEPDFARGRGAPPARRG